MLMMMSNTEEKSLKKVHCFQTDLLIPMTSDLEQKCLLQVLQPATCVTIPMRPLVPSSIRL